MIKRLSISSIQSHNLVTEGVEYDVLSLHRMLMIFSLSAFFKIVQRLKIDYNQIKRPIFQKNSRFSSSPPTRDHG